MRQRAKSLFIGAKDDNPFRSADDDSDVDDSDDGNDLTIDESNIINYDDNYNDDGEGMFEMSGHVAKDEDEFNWNTENDLRFVNLVLDQLPVDDKIPFESRVLRLNWNMIHLDDAEKHILKKRLREIIDTSRHFRVLKEVLDDFAAFRAKQMFKENKKKINGLQLYVKNHKEELKRNYNELNTTKNFLQYASDEFKELKEEHRVMYIDQVAMLRKPDESLLKTAGKRKPGDTPRKLFYQHKKLERKGKSTYTADRREYSNLSSADKLTWILRCLSVNRGSMLSADQYEKAKKCLNKEELLILDEYEGRPKRCTAYNMFLKEFFAKNKTESDANFRGYFKICATAWKNLTAEQRAPYEEKFETEKLQYEKGLRTFYHSLTEERKIYELNNNVKSRSDLKILNISPVLETGKCKKFHTSSDSESENEIKATKNKKIKKDKQTSVKEPKEVKAKKTPKVKKEKVNLETKTEEQESTSTEKKKPTKKSSKTAEKEPKKTKKKVIALDESAGKEDNLFQKMPDSIDRPKVFKKIGDDLATSTTTTTSPRKDIASKKTVDSTIPAISSPRKQSATKKNRSTSECDESPTPRKTNIFKKLLDTSQLLPPTPKIKKEKCSDMSDSSMSEGVNKRKHSMDLHATYMEFTNVNGNSTIIKDEPSAKKKKKDVESKKSKAAAPKDLEKSIEVMEMLNRVRPPTNLYTYFKQTIYKGPSEQAKEAFKNLNRKGRKKLNENFKAVNKKYLNILSQNVIHLSPNQVKQFQGYIEMAIKDGGESDSVSESD